MRIVECHRRISVEDFDLVNEQLSTEIVLGVHWSLPKITLKHN